MRKIIYFIFLVLISGTTYAYNIDGYLNDWGIDLNSPSAKFKGYLDNYTPIYGNDVDYVTEDNTDSSQGTVKVGPGYSYKNYYDAEFLGFDNDADYAYISVVTGLPSYGKNVGNGNWDPGDIIIGFDKDSQGQPKYTAAIDVSSYIYNSNNKLNKKAYFYTNVSQWADVYYSWNPDSGPWRMGKEPSNPSDEHLIDFVYSGSQNTHYVLEAKIPLSLLAIDPFSLSYKEIFIHWTMECGNDVLNLTADINNVIPEPASLFYCLLGIPYLLFKKKIQKGV